MLRNTSGQKWRVFAFNVTTNQEVLGDAANITAKLSKDYGTATALTDVNPTETEDGFYLFDLTQAETNAVDLAIYPESSTPNVQVIGVPGNFVTESSGSTQAPSEPSGGDCGVPFGLDNPICDLDISGPDPSLDYLILPFYFTSLPEMEREFSVKGIKYRQDDYSNSGQEKVLLEITTRATMEVKAILNKLYSDADLTINPWVRHKATIIGCYLYSIRRGNDSQYFNEYLDALEDLRNLLAGELYIDTLPRGSAATVVFHNISSDNRFPHRPIRTDWLTSTDVIGVKSVNYLTPFVWL